MSIGIPGIQAGSTPLVAGAPIFLSGDPQKEYEFTFVLTGADHVTSTKLPSWVTSLFSNLFLTYISGLAEQVTLPPSKITMGEVNVSTIRVPYVKGFEASPLNVVYLEDELSSVFRFHKAWQDNIRGSVDYSVSTDYSSGAALVKGGGSGTGLQFEPLGNVCCKAIFSRTRKVSIPVKDNFALGTVLPISVDVYPFIFPSEIQRSAANKGGNGISKTTVVYTRVPNISGWNSSETTFRNVSTEANKG